MRLTDFNVLGFPDGARHIQLGNGHPSGEVLTATIRSSQDLMDLRVVTDALENVGMKPRKLRLTYFPGRQDRHTAPGSPFTLKLIAQDINSMAYEEVEIFEPHSPVTCELIHNSRAVGMEQAALAFRDWLGWPTGELVIVAPDKGGEERAWRVQVLTGGWRAAFEKSRRPEDGRIMGMDLVSAGIELRGKRVLVVDDICDGGATFKILGESLKGRGVKSMALFVAHGIFSKGSVPLSAFDAVGTTDSFFLPNNSGLTWPKVFPAFPE